MKYPTPCCSGKARPCAAMFGKSPQKLLSLAAATLLLSATPISPALARSAHSHRHRAKPPTQQRPVSPPFLLTPTVLGRAMTPVQTLLVRDDLPAMGTNNGVRLWVRGDRSGAALRVRVLAPAKTASPSSDPLPRDQWISEPVPVNFVGWHEIVLPQAKFTLRAALPVPVTMDMSLPAEAQPAAADMNTAAPDWSAANGLALDVTTSRQTLLGVDDVAWVTLDSSGQGVKGTDSAVVTDFETGNVGAWKPVGTPEQTAAIVYGVTTQPGMVHGGRVAFRLTITPPGLGRRAQLQAAQAAMIASGKPYILWTPDSLFARVLPDSLPSDSGASPEVDLTACAEQTQAATFCLYSPVTLKNVIVSLPQDLQGIGHVLSRDAVDLRVVKVWPQSGCGPLRDPDTAGPAPALLVKDDRLALSGPAPAARLTGPAVCDIPADTGKQFWITVSVPRSTPPGDYVGRLLVSSRALPGPVVVRMALSVLPLRLLSPAKQYGIDLRSRLDPAPAALPSPDGRQLVTDFVPKNVLDKQLADIAAHGFSIASFYDSPDTLWDALPEYQAYGLGTSYNFYKGDGDPQAVESQRQAHSAPMLHYYADPEPNAAALARLDPLTKAGLLSGTYIPRQADYDALQADTDIVVYNRDSEYPQQLLRTKGQRVSQTRDWWYWSATNTDPKINRVDTGFLLWKANLYGAFLPDYQTAFGTDPYDQTSAGACPAKAAFRPLMLTYPTKDGVLDTLQWEACREGVNDVRYLTTMYAALRECKDNHVAAPLVAQAETYVKTFMDKPLANLPESQYDTFRAQTANYALLLRKAVDAYYKAHTVP